MAVATRQLIAVTQGADSAAIRVIGTDIATEWLEALHYAHQRVLRNNWAEFLAEEMRRGKFRPRTQIEIMHYQGKRYLIDGQHRLWAVILSGIPQVFTVVESYAESAEAIAWAYGNTDIGLRRTGNDLYSALELTDEFGITQTDVRNLSGAVPFMASGCIRALGSANPVHREDIVSMMRLYSGWMREYIAILAECGDGLRRPAMRAATLSIALLSLRYSAPAAVKRSDPPVAAFWRGAIFDDGIQLGDPRKVANRHLIGSYMGGHGKRHAGALVSAAYSSRFLARCFNAYMQGRELKMTKVFDEHGPLVMYGVPRDCKQWLV